MDVLDVYLQNHWAAAAGGVDLARRVAHTHLHTDLGPSLEAVAGEISEDRESLRALLCHLGVRPGPVAPVVVRVAERVGRLKPNGRLWSRSPASDVLELEALRAAVSAKRAGWDALLALSARLPTVPVDDVEHLVVRADSQLERLAELHRTLAGRRLRGA